MPYKNFENDWGTNYRPSKLGLFYQRHELGVIHKAWGIGFLQKNHTYLTFKKDTALALHAVMRLEIRAICRVPYIHQTGEIQILENFFENHYLQPLRAVNCGT